MANVTTNRVTRTIEFDDQPLTKQQLIAALETITEGMPAAQITFATRPYSERNTPMNPLTMTAVQEQ